MLFPYRPHPPLMAESAPASAETAGTAEIAGTNADAADPNDAALQSDKGILASHCVCACAFCHSTGESSVQRVWTVWKAWNWG